MTDQDSPHIELDALRRRWLESRTPQLSIRLAEEYRRRDRREEAVDVLEEALRQNPEHLAARVALGRYRLEMGDPDTASRELEMVVAKDPTNLVANKLLVSLHLDGGRPRQARDRLDLYKLLNESDPEIELLEERFADPHGTTGVVTPVAEAAPAELEEVEITGDEAAVPPRFEPEPEEPSLYAGPSESLATQEGDLFSLGEAPPPPVFSPAEPLAGRVAEDPVIEAGGGEPFPGLWVGLEESVVWELSPPDAIFELGPPTIGVSTTGLVAELSGDGLDAAVTDTAVPTATLGRLYLDQGHLEEAEATFLAILEREPGSGEARRGLATARSRRQGWLTAEELLTGDGPREDDTPHERRSRLLESYLVRLRSGVRRV